MCRWIKLPTPISIHAPPRGATFQPRAGNEGVDVFQFTPLREGRHVRRVKPGGFPYFNSRPSARGDLSSDDFTKTATKFQFTPLREGRHTAGSIPCLFLFQFTPLREGRLGLEHARAVVVISIHAPPRGATPPEQLEVLRQTISIHAPPRGATCRFACCFLAFCISIHAPPRGATNPPPPRAAVPLFQFTPLREGRP